MQLRFDRRVFAPDGADGAAPPAAPSGGETAVSGETSVPGESSNGEAFTGLDQDFGDDTGMDTIEIGAPEAPPTSSPASATPQKKPAPAAPEAQPAPAPVVAAEAPKPAPQVEAPPSAPQGPADVGSLIKELEANASGVIDALAADSRFGLNSDEVTMIETNPAQAVPRLLARTYYQAVNATLTHISNLVPDMIAKHLKGVELQQKYEKQFYGQFPVLNAEKHGADVYQFARLFKQQNPTMAHNDFFAMIGAAVMAKNGLMPGAAPPPSPAAAQAAIPQQPAAPPFAPASPGASVRTTPLEEHPFAGLGQEWDS